MARFHYTDEIRERIAIESLMRGRSASDISREFDGNPVGTVTYFVKIIGAVKDEDWETAKSASKNLGTDAHLTWAANYFRKEIPAGTIEEINDFVEKRRMADKMRAKRGEERIIEEVQADSESPDLRALNKLMGDVVNSLGNMASVLAEISRKLNRVEDMVLLRQDINMIAEAQIDTLGEIEKIYKVVAPKEEEIECMKYEADENGKT